MHLINLFSLPNAIVLLLCVTPSTAEAEPGWPHNLPRHMKYFPEDEVHVRRGLSIQQKMMNEKPIGVKKMSLDEGEMFLFDNWIFASDMPSLPDSGDLGNETEQVQSPLRPITENDFFSRTHIRDILMGRQFQCPDGTNSCSSIGAPDVCCGTGTNCINVNSNSDAGSVGCCPQGQTCAGPVHCDTSAGYSSCPGSSNGGCCLPGFRCQGVGCIYQGTSTSFVPLPSSSAPPRTSSTAVVVVPTSPPTTPTPTPKPSSTSSSSVYACSSGWFSCAASLGGGCCQTGLSCATGASCLGGDSTSTQAPSAPVRPTSGSAGAQAVPTTTDVCPNGFYVCSAYYPSGCCRVGRDCQTTGSCVEPTQTVVNSNGVVIFAPSGAAAATTVASQRGSCPSAWFSCPADEGGSCCPTGYTCGAMCTATASGKAGVTQKVAPSIASLASKCSLLTMLITALGSGLALIFV